MIPGSANPLLLRTAAAAGGYSISRSLRFNSIDSAYLSRTPASAGNRKTWTWAGWVKWSGQPGITNLFSDMNTKSDFGSHLGISSDHRFFFYEIGLSGGASLSTLAGFRDPSAWYHLIVAYDTTQVTGSNRFKLYVNGVQAALTGSYPNQNLDGFLNRAVSCSIGRQGIAQINYFNGLLADIHFCDGTAYDASAFGEFDANGIWQPKKFAGVYGTNGFYLPFSDNSTAAALGTDTSGRGNTWTVNNISVAAGAGNDSLVDVPTNGSEVDTGLGGEVRGNYATLNPLSNTAGSLSNGNLDQAGTASTNVRSEGTIAVSSGKWYFEITVNSLSGTYASIGVGTVGTTNKFPGEDATSYSWYPQFVNKQNNSSASAYGSAVSAGGVIMVALDLDNNKVFFGGNGTWFGSSNPATGANPAYTVTAGTYTPIARAYDTGSSFSFNFGQRPFAYTAPSGFKALNTANLPAPVITKPSTVMDVKLYTGNGSTQTISGLGFSPSLLWIKCRNAVESHVLTDKIRGDGNLLFSNSTSAEAPTSRTALGTNAFTVVDDASSLVNELNQTYAAWTWDAGSSTVTNTQGSITSQVRANASAGFSVVTYTGAGSTSSTVGHGLGVAPSFIITKARTTASQVNSWRCYHRSLGASQYITLNDTSAAGSFTDWANTSPTSSVFSVGGTNTTFPANESGINYVAYCFAPVAGYSSFGSYTGNGSADGPFQWCGFRPRWLMIKCASGSAEGNWVIYDALRGSYNLNSKKLAANGSYEENNTSQLGDDTVGIDFLSNGFKIRITGNNHNISSGTYVWAAFAESPFAANNRAR